MSPQWGHGVTAVETSRKAPTRRTSGFRNGVTASPPCRHLGDEPGRSVRVLGAAMGPRRHRRGGDPDTGEKLYKLITLPQWGHGVTAVETCRCCSMLSGSPWCRNGATASPRWRHEGLLPLDRLPHAAMGPRRHRRGDRSPGTRPFSRPNERGFERSQWAPGALTSFSVLKDQKWCLTSQRACLGRSAVTAALAPLHAELDPLRLPGLPRR